MLYKRHIKARLIELLDDFRIVYPTGPRQSGKSTLVREIAHEKGLGYYTLDDTALLASPHKATPMDCLAHNQLHWFLTNSRWLPT